MPTELAAETSLSVFDLWVPIAAAWLVTHVLSTLAWMALPHHKPEWSMLPVGPIDESARAHGAKPGGQYVLVDGPTDTKDASTGRGMLIYWTHKPSMGANIGMTLAFFLAAAFTIGYLASLALPRGADALNVFRFTATAGILCHVMAGIPTLIWFRRKCTMDLLDGLAYALATGAAFTLLWPE
jgi:hypothetical protein